MHSSNDEFITVRRIKFIGKKQLMQHRDEVLMKTSVVYTQFCDVPVWWFDVNIMSGAGSSTLRVQLIWLINRMLTAVWTRERRLTRLHSVKMEGVASLMLIFQHDGEKWEYYVRSLEG